MCGCWEEGGVGRWGCWEDFKEEGIGHGVGGAGGVRGNNYSKEGIGYGVGAGAGGGRGKTILRRRG